MIRHRNWEREQRIENEILVDAYGEEERAMSWYYYAENKIQFPFPARCILAEESSPLRKGEEVEVIGLPSEENCRQELRVRIRWQGRTLAVPLAQLKQAKPTGTPSNSSRTGITGRGWVISSEVGMAKVELRGSLKT